MEQIFGIQDAFDHPVENHYPKLGIRFREDFTHIAFHQAD
jgi:hypothetical protein